MLRRRADLHQDVPEGVVVDGVEGSLEVDIRNIEMSFIAKFMGFSIKKRVAEI